MARTFAAPLRRLAFVLAIVAVCLMLAVLFYNKTVRFNNGYERDFEGKRVYVGPRVFTLDLDQMDWFNMVPAIFMASLTMVILAVVGYGLYRLVSWIVYGPRQYEDPCQDDACPCQRHVVERDQAAAARNAAIAAAAATTTTTIINS